MFTLTSMELHNYKGFTDLSIDFNEQMTVIVGANGAGKTTILDAAAVALGTLFNSFNGIQAVSIEKTAAHLKAFKIGSGNDMQPQYPVVINARARMNGDTVEWKRCLNSESGKTTVIEAKEMTAISDEYQKRLSRGDESLILPILAYYGTGRLWDYHREKKTDVFGISSRQNGYIDALDGTANVKLMLNWLRKMAMQKIEQQEDGVYNLPEYDAVCHAMEVCFKRITDYDDVRVFYKVKDSEIIVQYTTPDGDRVSLPMSKLSDGYKGALSLIADIAYRMAVLNPQLLDKVTEETFGIVLIDEIDLHLHPAWQARILGDLREIFPKVQFIVTTHAPAVINTVRSENLVVLKNESTDNSPVETYGKDINSVITAVMDADERPLPVKQMFDMFYDLLAENKLQEAEKLLDEIEALIGDDDHEVASCRTQLALVDI